MEGLIGAVIPTLERAMRFRVQRQGVLAANLANVDTPGYRRIDLQFESELGAAATRLRRTDSRHLEGSRRPGENHRLSTERPSTRPDRNGVEIQREVIAASRNAGAFTDQAAVVSRLLVMRRIAVTGEPR